MTNPLYRDMANTDFMTELKNRNSYDTDRQNLDAKKKWNGLTVAVIDVNNLKLVNDRLGHAVGDDCIVNAARVLQSVESQKVTAYRYGGDEFILLLENYPEPEKLLVRVKEKFAKYGDKQEVPVALAAGYAQFDENLDQEIADTQRRADEQMYQDKMKIKRSQEKRGNVENGH